MSYELQHFLRDQLLKNELVSNEFQQMKVLNKIDDIIDKAVISSNNWFLYGSKKAESHAYKVTHAYKYNSTLTETVIDDNYPVELFSMRNTDTDNNVTIKATDSITVWQKVLLCGTNVVRRKRRNCGSRGRCGSTI